MLSNATRFAATVSAAACTAACWAALCGATPALADDGLTVQEQAVRDAYACQCPVLVDLGPLGVWVGQFGGGVFTVTNPATGQTALLATTSLHTGPPVLNGGVVVAAGGIPIVTDPSKLPGFWQPAGPNLWPHPGLNGGVGGEPLPSASPATPDPRPWGGGDPGDRPHEGGKSQ